MCVHPQQYNPRLKLPVKPARALWRLEEGGVILIGTIGVRKMSGLSGRVYRDGLNSFPSLRESPQGAGGDLRNLGKGFRRSL